LDSSKLAQSRLGISSVTCRGYVRVHLHGLRLRGGESTAKELFRKRRYWLHWGMGPRRVVSHSTRGRLPLRPCRMLPWRARSFGDYQSASETRVAAPDLAPGVVETGSS